MGLKIRTPDDEPERKWWEKWLQSIHPKRLLTGGRPALLAALLLADLILAALVALVWWLLRG